MMSDLGLGVPEICWHAARDGLAEFVSVLALIAATMGKIAHEVILLQKSEVAELEEPYQPGKVGSSTMPHKRNPMLCEGILAEARLVQPEGALVVEHGRRHPVPVTADWDPRDEWSYGETLVTRLVPAGPEDAGGREA